METILSVVRNLVFLVLLAAFLELLLPLKDSRKFVQVILGLFVLAVVLNPIVSLFCQTPLLSLNYPAKLDDEREELHSILAQGEVLQQAAVGQARTAYVERLEQQAAALARLVPGVEEAAAEVELAPSSSLQSLGVISKVFIRVKPGQKERGAGLVNPVEKIKVGKEALQEQEQLSQTNRNPSNPERGLLSQVQETVASLFGLRPEQVVVNLESPR